MSNSRKGNRIVATTQRTYPLLSMKRIFHNSQPIRDGVILRRAIYFTIWNSWFNRYLIDFVLQN